MHWNSCCKLLSETLVRLEATEAEMRHVLLIRSEEFDWLEKCEHSSAIRRRTCGDLNLLQSETEMHQVKYLHVCLLLLLACLFTSFAGLFVYFFCWLVCL